MHGIVVLILVGLKSLPVTVLLPAHSREQYLEKQSEEGS